MTMTAQELRALADYEEREAARFGYRGLGGEPGAALRAGADALDANERLMEQYDELARAVAPTKDTPEDRELFDHAGLVAHARNARECTSDEHERLKEKLAAAEGEIQSLRKLAAAAMAKSAEMAYLAEQAESECQRLKETTTYGDPELERRPLDRPDHDGDSGAHQTRPRAAGEPPLQPRVVEGAGDPERRAEVVQADAEHCACTHDGRGELTSECQEHQEQREAKEQAEARLVAVRGELVDAVEILEDYIVHRQHLGPDEVNMAAMALVNVRHALTLCGGDGQEPAQ